MEELDATDSADSGGDVELQQPSESQFPVPNERHLARLRKSPETAEFFDTKFGVGAAARHLGTSPLAREFERDGTFDAAQRHAAVSEASGQADQSIAEAWEAGRRKVQRGGDLSPEDAAARRGKAFGAAGELTADDRSAAALAERETARSTAAGTAAVAGTIEQAVGKDTRIPTAAGGILTGVRGLFRSAADDQQKRLDHAERMVRGEADLPEYEQWRSNVDKLAKAVVEFAAAKPAEYAGIVGGLVGERIGIDIKPEDNAAVRLGKQIEDWAKTKFPSDPARQYEFTGKVMEGLGSTAAFGGTGLLVRMAGAGERGTLAAIALSGAAGNVPDEFEKATKAMAGGTATEMDRLINTLANSALGMTEALPFAGAFAPRGAGGVGAALKRTSQQAVDEGGQEFVQQFGTNVSAKATFDPSRDPYEGVLEGVAVAGITGGAFGAGMSRSQGRAERAEDKQRKAQLEALQAAIRGEEPGSTSTVDGGTVVEPARPDFPASSAPKARTPADVAQAPGFSDILSVLPKDANGDPDLAPLIQQLSERGTTAWGKLTPEQRSEVYRVFNPVVEAVQTAVQSVAGQSPEVEPVAAQARPANATQAQSAKFDAVLAGKTARKDWAKASGLSEVQLKPFIDAAVSDGRLAMVRGQPRRTGKKAAPVKVEPAKAAPASYGGDTEYAVKIIPTFLRSGPDGLAKQLAGHSVEQIRGMARAQGVKPQRSAEDKASVIAAVVEAVRANRRGVAAAAGSDAVRGQRPEPADDTASVAAPTKSATPPVRIEPRLPIPEDADKQVAATRREGEQDEALERWRDDQPLRTTREHDAALESARRELADARGMYERNNLDQEIEEIEASRGRAAEFEARQSDLFDQAVRQQEAAKSPFDYRPGADKSGAEPGLDEFVRQLVDGEFRTIVDARKAAKEAGIAETGKDLDERIELELVTAARSIVSSTPDEADAYQQLVTLYDNQPNLGVRTSTSVANQAYSTPLPLAYLASRLARVADAGVVYEPTAGNGALLIETDTTRQTVVANELDPKRSAALRMLGFQATSLDATDPKQSRSIRSSDPAGAVIMNPPFGAVSEKGRSRAWTVNGLQTTSIDHAIGLQALEAMADDGTGVLILGGIKAESTDERRKGYRGKAKREFYTKLYSQYNVTDHFTVSGDLYKKQGAGWPVDVIVIDGRGKSKRTLPAAVPPPIFDSWDALAEKLPNGPKASADAGIAGTTDAATDRGVGEPGSRDAVGVEPAGGERPVEPRTASGGDATGVRARGDRGQSGSGAVASDAPGVPEPAGPERDRDAGATSQPDAPRQQRVKREAKGGQAPYEPASNATPLDTLIPVNMATAARAALRRIEEAHGSVDEYVAERLGYEPDQLSRYFSAEQVDALAAGISNVENGSALIIGDQTGIGKGRVVAGMLRYAIRKGLVPVLVTEKPDLYGDMYRDMRDIGLPEMLGREPSMFMTNAGETVSLDEEAVEWRQEVEIARANGTKAPPKRGRFLSGGSSAKQPEAMRAVLKGQGGFDVVFTTYDQMNTVRGSTTPRRQFLSALAPNALFAFDESHNAGGAAKTGWESKNAEMNRADFARDIAKRAAGVVFSSATYAKRPDVMDLYARTDMGKAVDDPKLLPALIQKGGVPMQQIVASMLSDSGQYLRRERSFDGVEYAVEPVPVDTDTYRQFSQAIRAVFKFDLAVKDVREEILEDVLDRMGSTQAKDTGVGEAAAHTTSFSSLMHNIVGQMLLAIKAGATGRRAVEAFKAGEKPVIALANTNESFIKNFAEQEGISIGEVLQLDFGDVLRRYLDRTLRITTTDSDGNSDHVQIPVSDLPLHLQEQYNDALASINDGDYAGLPISPIDAIRHTLTKAGMSVAEVTGRQTMIDYGADVPKYVQRPRKEQGPSGKRASIAAFNSGKLDAIILNRSGSTGVSMHASEKFKDQRRRRMILAQAEANIDTHLQMLGRVHRTGQVMPPAYSQIAAEIPAEARPTAVLMRKMASLNANTTGARGSVFMADSADFMNEVGDKVVYDYLREYPEIEDELGGDIFNKSEDEKPWVDAAKRATGRLVLLEPEKQTEFLEAVQQGYKDAIEELDALGENPLEAKTLDLQARVLETTELKASSGDGPFLAAAVIEKVSVKSSGRSMSMAEVAAAVATAVGAEKPAGEPVAALQALADRGDKWATTQSEDLRRRFEAWLPTAIVDLSAEGKASTSERERESLRRITAILDIAYPGARVSMTTQDGELNGIVLAVERTGRSKSPAAPGAWTVSVAVPDSMRVLKLSMAKIFPPSVQMKDGDKGARLFRSSESYADIAAALDKARLEGRETRYAVTGNILAGYDSVLGSGRIVNFTNEDGTLRPGILLGRDFNVSRFMDKRAVRFQGGEHAAAFLDKVPAATVRSNDGNVSVTARNGQYQITTAASRAKGGRYFTDNDVRSALAPDEFVKNGQVMVARTSDRKKVVKALDAIRAAGALLETTSGQDVAIELAPKPKVRKADAKAKAAAATKSEPQPPPLPAMPTASEVVSQRKDRSYALSAAAFSDGVEQARAARVVRSGQVYEVAPEVAAGMRAAIKRLPNHMLPASYQTGFLRAARTAAGGMVEVAFERLDGSIAVVEVPSAVFSGGRALSDPISGTVGFISFDLPPGFERRLGSELWHEVIHALREVSALDGVFKNVAAHAASLRIMEMTHKEFTLAIGDPSWDERNGEIIAETYLRAYAGRPNLQRHMDEEAIAHMAELLAAGVPLPLPENIRRIFEAIETGAIARGEVVATDAPGTIFAVDAVANRQRTHALAVHYDAVPIDELGPDADHPGRVVAPATRVSEGTVEAALDDVREWMRREDISAVAVRDPGMMAAFAKFEFKPGSAEEKFILENYHKMGLHEIAERLGYSVTVTVREVRAVLYRNGITPRSRGDISEHAMKVASEKRSAIIDDFKSGIATDEIARRYNVTVSGVLGIMSGSRKVDDSPHYRNPPRNVELVEFVAKNSGRLSYGEIAKAWNNDHNLSDHITRNVVAGIVRDKPDLFNSNAPMYAFSNRVVDQEYDPATGQRITRSGTTPEAEAKWSAILDALPVDKREAAKVERRRMEAVGKRRDVMFAMADESVDRISQAETGKPITFQAFRGTIFEGIDANKIQLGQVWATVDKALAGEYAINHWGWTDRPWQPNVQPLEMNFRNPLVVKLGKPAPASSIPFDGEKWISDDLADLAKRNGHDGIIITNVIDHPSRLSQGNPATIVAALPRGTVRSSLNGDMMFALSGTRDGLEPVDPKRVTLQRRSATAANIMDRKAKALDYINDALEYDRETAAGLKIQREATADVYQGKRVVYNIMMDGKPIGEIDAYVDGKTASILFIGGTERDETGAFFDSASLGVPAVRKIREEFRKDFPEVTTFTGDRISGSRRGQQTVMFAMADGNDDLTGPMRVYHGTSSAQDFNRFNSPPWMTDAPDVASGAAFIARPDAVLADYPDLFPNYNRGRVLPLDIAPEKPFIIDYNDIPTPIKAAFERYGYDYNGLGADVDAHAAAAKMGHDFVIYKNTPGDFDVKQNHLQIVPLKSGLVRSATTGDMMFAFAGERARTADHDALAVARQMEQSGPQKGQPGYDEHRTKIWTATGWFRGPDGKWRFEIDDSGVGRKDITKMGDRDPSFAGGLMDHKKFFDAYPQASEDLARRMTPQEAKRALGSINTTIRPDGRMYMKHNPTLADREYLSTALHEFQHGVQTREGFGAGANSLSADYWRMSGEVEARTVQKRMDMTPSERRARPPWLDYDVPEDQQIVRFADGAGVSQMSYSSEPPIEGLPTIKGDMMFAISAFHGSPHDFDKFKMKNVGSGEGAQAYGAGLYFAENVNVAQKYMDAGGQYPISKMKPEDYAKLMMIFVGRHMQPDDARAAAIAHLKGVIADENNVPDRLIRLFSSDKRKQLAVMNGALQSLEQSRETKETPRFGHLYQVRINVDPSQMLDWDSRLADQPEPIRAAMTKLANGEILPDWTGMDAYRSVGSQMMTNLDLESPELMRRVRAAGIRGIMYSDAYSRYGAETQTRNFVIFDESLIEITAKDGQPVGKADRQSVIDGMIGKKEDGSGPMYAMRDTGDKPVVVNAERVVTLAGPAPTDPAALREAIVATGVEVPDLPTVEAIQQHLSSLGYGAIRTHDGSGWRYIVWEPANVIDGDLDPVAVKAEMAAKDERAVLMEAADLLEIAMPSGVVSRNGSVMFAFANRVVGQERDAATGERLTKKGTTPEAEAKWSAILDALPVDKREAAKVERRRMEAQNKRGGTMFAFAGPKAVGADLGALGRAEGMESRGDTPSMIWMQTGWFRGVDEKWRWEIDDSRARMRRVKMGEQYLADEAVVHNGLFAAYPVLGEILVYPTQGSGGSFGREGDLNIGMQSADPPITIALHELQHAIQQLEGFARGGSSGIFTLEEVERERDRLAPLYPDRLPSEMTEPGLRWSLYSRLAGEVEARTVERRRTMTPVERRAVPPWISADIDGIDQIVRSYVSNDDEWSVDPRSYGPDVVDVELPEMPDGRRALVHGSAAKIDRLMTSTKSPEFGEAIFLSAPRQAQTGHAYTYTVAADITPDDVWDLSLPITQNSERVQEALQAIGVYQPGGDLRSASVLRAVEGIGADLGLTLTAAGIKALRNTGRRAHGAEYVVFDESLLEIVETAERSQVMFAFGGGKSKWRRSSESLSAAIEKLKDATGMTVIQGLRGMGLSRGDAEANIIPGDGRNRGRTADGRPRQRFGNTWIGGRRIDAQYDNYSGVARMRSVRRLDETAHEAGHHLERIIGAPLLDLHTQFGTELDGMAIPGLADTRSEQWSEWFRLYVVNPDAARMAAPGLYAAFEDVVDAEMPGMLPKLEAVQEAVAKHMGQSPLDQVANDLVAARHRNIAQRAYGSYRDGTLAGDVGVALSNFYSAGIDRMNSLWKVTSALLSIADRNGVRDAAGKPISLKMGENPAKRFRAFAGSYKKGHNWLMKGIRDTDGTEIAPPLRDALIKVFGAGSESGLGTTAAAVAGGVAGAAVGGPVGAVVGATLSSALYGNATDRMRNTGWDTERYQKFNAYVMAQAALERYRQYEEKQQSIATLNSGMSEAAAARPGLAETAAKTKAVLERRRVAAIRIDTLLKDRRRDLGASDTAIRRTAQQLDAKKDDVLGAQMGRDKALARRRDDDRMNLEKRQKEAVKVAETLQREVDGLEIQQSMIEAEIDQLTEAADTASRRVEALDDAVQQLRDMRQRELGGGIHRPPVLEVKDRLQQTIEQAEREYPDFVEAARIFHEYVHGLLVMEYRAGFHTPEQFAALAANKDWYAPLMRDLTDIREAKYGSGTLGSKWQKYQALKGSDRAVLNPVDVIIERSYALARKTAYDAAVKSLVQLVRRAGPGAGVIAEEVERTEVMADSQATWNRIVASAKSMGLDDVEANRIIHLMEHELSGSDIHKISAPTGRGPKAALQVPYWENGERKMLRINDPEFALEVFESMNGIGEELHHWLVDAIAKPSRWLSFGVTAHPAFAIVNMTRDMMAAWMTTGATPLYTQAKGIAMELSTHKLFDSAAFRDWSPVWIKRKVGEWQEFVRAYHDGGGIRGGQFTASLGDVKDKAEWTGLRRDGFNIEFRRIWDIIELAETSTRLGVARMAMKRAKAFDPTLTDPEALAEGIFTARDVMDFDRRGSKMAAATRIVAFLNPNLQGIDKAIRSGTGSGDRGSVFRRKLQIVMKRDSGIELSAQEEVQLADAYKFWFRLMAFNAAVVAIYMLHAGDPEEEEITDRMKQSHAMIDVANIWNNFTSGKIGQMLGMEPSDRKQENWKRAPLPFELATPAIVGIWALRTHADKDPASYERLWDSLYDLLAPPVIPQLWKVVGEPASNYSAFSGRPIVSSDLQKLDPAQRYEWFNSTIAKNVGAALNVAPMKVDYVITNGFGYLGKEVQRYGEWLLPGGRQRPGQDEDMLTKRLKADPYKSSNAMTEFYKQMRPDGGGGGPVSIIKGIVVHDGEQYVQAASGYKKIIDEQNPIAAKAWLTQKPDEMRAYATLMGHFNTAAQNVHPINRLDKVVTVINRMQREVLNGDLKEAIGPSRRRGVTLESVFKPALQDEEVLVDILNRVKVIEARNTFIAIGHGRWGGSNQKQLPVDLVLDELKTANGAVYDEFMKRIQMTKVPSLEGAAAAWKKAKPLLLKEQEEAAIEDYGFDGNPQVGTREDRRQRTPRVLAR